MDTDKLISEAESFSPPKSVTIHHDTPDMDLSEFKNIPHGLSHKHLARKDSQRRNSTSAIRAPLSNINSSPSPTKYKNTYTCPRPNKFSGKQLVGLNKLKTNLDSVLKNATTEQDEIEEDDNNKENSFATPSKIQAYQQHLHTPSIASKRRSSEVSDSSKRLKSDDSVLKTPLRPTEPVAASPTNEQNSRIIDNSHLLLDNGKSPNVSSAMTSPLANVSHLNSSHINHSSADVEIDAQTMLAEDSLQEVEEENIENPETNNKRVILPPLNFDTFQFKDGEDDDGNGSDFEPTISSPMSRPTFTLRQVEELQGDHSSEISKLEQIVNDKNSTLAELSNSLNEISNSKHGLEVKLTALEVERNKFIENNKILTMRISSLESMSTKLNKQLKQKDNKINQLNEKATHFSENQAKILQAFQEMESNIVSLQANLDVEQDNNKDLNVKIGTLTNTISNLKVNLKEKSTEIETLINSRQDLRDQISKQTEILTQQEEEIKQLNEKLEQKAAEMKDLDEFKNDLEDAIESCNQKISEFEDKNLSLLDQLEVLTQDYKLKKLESDEQLQEINDLHTSLESKMKELDILFDQKEELLQTNNRLSNELDEEKEATSQIYKDLELARSSLKSTNSEIDDLRTQNSELKIQLESTELELKELQDKYNDQESKYEASMKENDDFKNNEIEVVEELKNKLEYVNRQLFLTETQILEKTGEIDSLQRQVNEVSDQLISKNAETENLKNKLDQMQETLEEKDASTSLKLQQLAQDLYVQYSKKHEQKVSILKKGYETKWSNKFKELESDKSNLIREVESLRKQLGNEREEKKQLVKLWEQSS